MKHKSVSLTKGNGGFEPPPIKLSEADERPQKAGIPKGGICAGFWEGLGEGLEPPPMNLSEADERGALRRLHQKRATPQGGFFWSNPYAKDAVTLKFREGRYCERNPGGVSFTSNNPAARISLRSKLATNKKTTCRNTSFYVGGRYKTRTCARGPRSDP